MAASEEDRGVGYCVPLPGLARLESLVGRGFHCRRQSESLDHRIVERWPHLGNFVVFPRRVDAIRQQHHEDLAVRIDPNRSARETGMPEAVRRKVAPAGAALGRHHPAQRARPARKLLRHRELRNR